MLERFGEPIAASAGAAAVRLEQGTEGISDVVRALDQEDLRVAHLELSEPSLNDAYFAKTGRKLEGAGDEKEVA